MRLKQAISIFFLALFVLSCSSESAKDIKTGDIKNECDCVSSLQIIVDELSILKDADPNRENKAQMQVLSSKLKEIKTHCYQEFKVEKMKDCDGFNQLEKDIDALR